MLVIEFRVCDPGRPPARDLIAAVLAEYDERAGRPLRGGPSATARDFSPPARAYVAGFIVGRPACGAGIKRLADGVAELKRMYVAPAFRGRGVGPRLLEAAEDTARELGYDLLRLDSQASTWPVYREAGYRQIADYNCNPHADVWAEKRL